MTTSFALNARQFMSLLIEMAVVTGAMEN